MVYFFCHLQIFFNIIKLSKVSSECQTVDQDNSRAHVLLGLISDQTVWKCHRQQTSKIVTTFFLAVDKLKSFDGIKIHNVAWLCCKYKKSV